jgi:hypothetical protein
MPRVIVTRTAGSIVRRVKGRLAYRHDLAAEKRALRDAQVVVCNSRRTYEDVIARTGVEPSRAHVVYYGCDPVRFSAVGAADRVAAKAALVRSRVTCVTVAGPVRPARTAGRPSRHPRFAIVAGSVRPAARTAGGLPWRQGFT